MRSATLVMVMMLLAVGALASAENVHQINLNQNNSSIVGYAPNQIIVQLEENVIPYLDPQAMKSGRAFSGIAELEEVGHRYGVTGVDKKFVGMDFNNAFTPQERALTRFFRVHVNKRSIDAAIAAYEELPMVTRAYRVALHQMDATPNDPQYTDQWHYYNDYSVNADEAWDMESGDASVVVGILDSGVKYDHGDLGGSNPPGPDDASTNGNIWVNDQEIPGNGVDDDGNGYIDDVIGYDFLVSSFRCKDADCYDMDNDPMDGLGHGTHCSGTVSAINNNGYKVAGVAGGYNDGTTGSAANGVKILCCRIGYATANSGVVDMGAAADAMVYTGQLKARGVNVAAINCSWGSSESADLAAAVDYLISQDVLVVVSAGNSGSTSASYLAGRADCMAVGATDINGNPASFSNYGSWVDIAAPGVNILSTVAGTGDQTALYSGTSMSSPHICGVTALLESYEPDLSRQEKWDLICDPDNVNPYNETKYVGVGIASAKLCLDAIGTPICTDPPEAGFGGTPTSGDYPLTVNFTDQSTNGPTSWDWNFGDGSAHVYTQNASHQYVADGTYTVTLIATNDCGSDAETKTDYITVTESNDPPVAAFTGTPTSGSIPLEVTFTDQSTGGATSWTWNFGDGSPVSNDQSPVHTYTSVGYYTVTLTASNTYGSDDETKIDYINATEVVDNSMYVYDINVWRVSNGRNCDSYVQVWIHDNDNQPLEGADVSVLLSGPLSGSGTFTTEADGSITVHSGSTKSCTGDFCWEVTNVVKTDYTYDSAANNETMVCESGVIYSSDGDDKSMVSAQYSLSQNYPNPFNPTSDISFSLPKSGHAVLTLYDIRGRKVATLAEGMFGEGTHTITLDASKMSSGVYFYQLISGDFSDKKKMVLLK